MSFGTRPFPAPWQEREVVKSNVIYGQLINKLNNHDLQVSEGIPIKNAVILFVLYQRCIFRATYAYGVFVENWIEFMPLCINSIQNNTKWSL
jgi:hypothetical protein